MNNLQHDIDKAYVSPIDRFLYEFDATHDKSASQLIEIKKYQKIFALRDHARPEGESEEVWTGF